MDIQGKTVADAIRRLKRIEGQVRGLQQVLTDERNYQDVLIDPDHSAGAAHRDDLRLDVSHGRRVMSWRHHR